MKKLSGYQSELFHKVSQRNLISPNIFVVLCVFFVNLCVIKQKKAAEAAFHLFFYPFIIFQVDVRDKPLRVDLYRFQFFV